MKIKISPELSSDRVIIDVPPVIPDLSDKIEVIKFQIPNTSISPCEEVQVEWTIRAKKDNINLDDYQFRLRVGYAEINSDISAEGSESFSVYKDTTLSLSARNKESDAPWSPIGNPLPIYIDGENEKKQIPQILFDALAFEHINREISGIKHIEFRSDIKSNWTYNYIEYTLPLELKIPNFFNGNLDIKLRLFIKTEFDSGGDTSLEVSIESSENLKFDIVEDIFSFGHTSTIEKTVEKLLPIIMNFITSNAEKVIIRQLLNFLNIDNYLEDRRLMEVNIIPGGEFGHIQFLFCSQRDGAGYFGSTISRESLNIGIRT